MLEWVVISFLTCKSRDLEAKLLRGMRKAGGGGGGTRAGLQDAAGILMQCRRRPLEGEWLAGQPVRRV